MSSGIVGLLQYRWRVFAAGAIGMIAGLWASHRGVGHGASSLVGWNIAALLYVCPTLMILFFDDAAKVRERAAREDENRAVIMSLILIAVGISLGAIVLAMSESKSPGHGGHHPVWLVGLTASTLVLSWMVVQSLFALHYAHRYFGDRDDDGSADKGLQFTGDPPRTYRDFIYVAICIGATCQVSDFNITNTQYRNLVTAHALIAFVFNTMVIALGVNIFGNVMGQ